MDEISRRAFLRILGLGALAGAVYPRSSFALKAGAAGEIAGLINPHGLCAIGEDHIAVAESGDYSIKVFKTSPTVEPTLTFGHPGSRSGRLNFPVGISTDPAGNFVVCDTNNGRVCVFDKNGRFIDQYGSLGGSAENLFAPHAARVYKDRLYVANTRSHWITVFDYTTKDAVAVFGEFGDDAGDPAPRSYRFRQPTDLWVDESGVFVLDSKHARIVVLELNGNLERIIELDAVQPSSFARTKTGWAIADLADKKLIFTDEQFSQLTVERLDFRPWGIAELNGSTWVSDPEGGRVLRLG